MNIPTDTHSTLSPSPTGGGQGKGLHINLITLCSGYDSQKIALDMFCQDHKDITCDLLAWSEIDEPAIAMHNQVFPEYADRNLGDMTKIDWERERTERSWGEIDLLTYSTPCQSISQAGKQAGLAEGSGTRSSILWHTEDAIKVLRPRFLIQENVFALVSKKFIGDFHKWCERVLSYGYRNFLPPIFQREDGTKTKLYCMNAKDYGVPQNRERVYMVSIREDVYQQQFLDRGFAFQGPSPLELRLEDILEDEVAPNHFLKDEQVQKFLITNNTDQAVFLHSHEATDHRTAMFIKTWMHRWFREQPGRWNLSAGQLGEALELAKADMQQDYDDWQHDRQYSVRLCNDFWSEFEWNMKRKEGMPEWWEV